MTKKNRTEIQNDLNAWYKKDGFDHYKPETEEEEEWCMLVRWWAWKAWDTCATREES